jgi:protein phosphatase 4 regulatory subunit 3
VDIINYIQNNDSLLRALFISFRDFDAGESSRDAVDDDHRREVVMLLHQLVLMGKNVQLPNRLQLYRNLVDRGLLYVCEWGFRQTDMKVLNASTEMLALILDHDVSAVRSHALRENEMKRKTLVIECTELLKTSRDLGIKSQIADSLKSMLDIGGDGPEAGLVGMGGLARQRLAFN